MKKALVVLMAIAMVFCFATATMAASYSDMDNATKAQQDAVTRLSGLGVLAGYTDGTFGPNEPIRRDEMAKIAAIAGGFGDAADAMAGQATGYTDVAKGIWSTGYVNIASAQGYMKGTGMNMFSPALNITNAEVLTTVLRMYGYNDNLVGPWPINYVNQAIKDGLTDDIPGFASGDVATRANVAVMVSEALDQIMVEYSKDVEDFQDKQYGVPNSTTEDFEVRTLFDVAFGGEKVEKVLITKLAVAQYDAEEGLEYAITVADQYGNTKTFDCSGDTVINGTVFYGLADKYATIIYKKDKTGNDDALTINITSTDVTFTNLERTGDDKVKVNGTTTYDFQDGFTYASDRVGATVKANLKATDDKLKASKLNENGTVSLDFDGNVYMIKADKDKATGGLAVVTDIDTAKEKLELNAGTFSTGNWDAMEKVAVIKAGKIVGVEGLAVGDVISYKAAGRVAVVETAKGITGVVGTHDSTKVAIGSGKYFMGNITFVQLDGDDYKAPGGGTNLLLYTTSDGGLKGEEVTVYKNNKNEVVLAIYGETTATVYGVMLGVDSNDAKEEWGIAENIKGYTVFNSEGKTVDYTVSEDFDDNAEAVVDELGYGSVVKLILTEDGEIDDIELVEDVVDTDDYNNEEQNADGFAVSNNKYINLGTYAEVDKYALADDVVIMNMTEDKEDLEVELISAGSFLADDVSIAAIAVGDDQAINLEGLWFALNLEDEIEFVAMTDFGGTDDDNFGLTVGKTYSDGDDWFVNIDGTAIEFGEIEEFNPTSILPAKVVKYDIEGGKVVAIDVVSLATDSEEWEQVTAMSGDLVTTEDGKYELASDVRVYLYDDGDYVNGSIDDIGKGSYVKSLDTNDDDETTQILVMDERDKTEAE